MIHESRKHVGFGATIIAKALVIARGDWAGAAAFLEGANARPWADALRAKAAATAIGSSDAPAFLPIVQSLDEAIRPLAILPRLTGTVSLPPNARLIGGTGIAAASWAGEGGPIPVGAAAFEDRSTLAPLSVSAIVVVDDELARMSDPRANDVLGRDLIGAAAEAMDRAFIDPTNAGTTDVKPASITYGATSFTSSGSTVAAIDADLQRLLGRVTDGDSPLDNASWVMRPRTCAYLAGLRGTGGAPAFPGVTARGGTLYGLPIITSRGVPEVGSPQTSSIALVDGGAVAYVDEGGADIEMATQAAIQMDSAPGAGAQSLVSLWQLGLVALKITRRLNWRRRRDSCAAVLTDVGF